MRGNRASILKIRVQGVCYLVSPTACTQTSTGWWSRLRASIIRHALYFGSFGRCVSWPSHVNKLTVAIEEKKGQDRGWETRKYWRHGETFVYAVLSVAYRLHNERRQPRLGDEKEGQSCTPQGILSTMFSESVAATYIVCNTTAVFFFLFSISLELCACSPAVFGHKKSMNTHRELNEVCQSRSEW